MSSSLLDYTDQYNLISPVATVWGCDFIVPSERAINTHADCDGLYVHLDPRVGVAGPSVVAYMASLYPEGTLRPSSRKKAMTSLQVVLNSIARALVMYRGYGVPCRVKYHSTDKYYAASSLQKKLGIRPTVTAKFVKDVLVKLEGLGWITRLPSKANLKSSFMVHPKMLPTLAVHIDDIGGGTRVRVTKPEPFFNRKLKRMDSRNVTDLRGVTVHALPMAATWHKALTKISKSLSKYTYAVALPDGRTVAIGAHNFIYSVVFNSRDCTKGGRAYCAAQNLPSRSRAIRQTLTIDGKATIEIDFSNLHVRMLYNQIGLEFEGDCYDVDVPGWNPDPVLEPAEFKRRRSLLKVMLLSMPNAGENAKSKIRSALSTANASVENWKKAGEKAWHENNPGQTMPAGLFDLPDGITYRELLDGLFRAHAPIADLFHTGAGIKLQAIDGLIARNILTYFTQELDRPCFAVHDGFMVWVEDGPLLQQRMELEYFAAMGFKGIAEAKPVLSKDLVLAPTTSASVHELQNLNKKDG